jgi:phage anti-repressor protein
MADIIKKATIDFKDLVENTKNCININFQSHLISTLNNNFNDEEQRWFIANFYVFLNYHPTEDYPINLEDVYEMIGFANKGNAKRTLLNNFIENEDYKSSFVLKDKSSYGGSGGEKIILNIETFKMLCMLAKTNKGKKIRSYYIKLENINNKILKEQMEQSNKLLIEKEQQLQIQNNIVKMLENKPETEGFYHTVGFIYILKDNAKYGHYKIGLSEAPDKRVWGLNVGSSTKSIEIVDTYKTNDSILAEKIIHAVLFSNKIKKQKEWFYISNENLLKFFKKTVVECINFSNNYIFDSIEDELNFIENKSIQKKTYKKTTTISTQTDIEAIKDTELETNDKDEIIFNDFFKNCCIVDNLVHCSKRDIFYQYRTWSKIHNIYNYEKFEIYLTSKFKQKKIYNELFKADISNILGIRLNDNFYKFEFDEPLDPMQIFLTENCIKLPTAKLNRSSIKDSYEKWCEQNDIKVNNISSEINKLSNLIDKYFFKDLFKLGESSYYGWYGITLKENFLQGTGLSNTMCKKNKIYKIYNDDHTKIIKEWESQREVAREYMLNYSTCGNRIKKRILFMDTNKKEFYLIKEEDYKKNLHMQKIQ